MVKIGTAAGVMPTIAAASEPTTAMPALMKKNFDGVSVVSACSNNRVRFWKRAKNSASTLCVASKRLRQHAAFFH